MADFHLNPRYSRYELGIVELDRRSVMPIVKARPSSLLRFRTKPHLATTLLYFGAVMLIVCPLSVLINSVFPVSKRFDFFDHVGEFTLVCLLLLIVAYVVSMPQRQKWQRIYRRLEKTRRVIDGTLIEAVWRSEDFTYYQFEKSYGWRERQYLETVLVAHYEFVSPTSDQRLRGSTEWERPDLKGKPLPPPGTPIRVLYADDETHIML
ncbi:MAG: hypothetical protein U0670_22685 [Anaerolineae bacterium]